MKRLLYLLLIGGLISCGQQAATTETETAEATLGGGQSTVQDDESAQDVVRVAVNSPDHKTLVAALQAAEYVDALSNAGPFTVFAPTDEAFGKLPEGTVDNLVKPENKNTLRNILEYHVYVGVINENYIKDGMNLNQVNLDNVKLTKVDGKLTKVNDANVLGSVKATNGIIYVIDGVLLPPEK